MQAAELRDKESLAVKEDNDDKRRGVAPYLIFLALGIIIIIGAAAFVSFKGLSNKLVNQLTKNGHLNNVTDTNPSPPSQPIILRKECGLGPDLHAGQVTVNFKGFSKHLDEQEVSVVEQLVLETYNQLIVDEDDGCTDPFLREIKQVELVYQHLLVDYTPPAEYVLQTVFEASIACDGCSPSNPLFSTERSSNLRPRRGLETTEMSLGWTSNEFFQRWIQQMTFGTEMLTHEEKISQRFISISKAFVTTLSQEEVLVTSSKYENRDDNRGWFQFNFTNEVSNEPQTSTLLVDRAFQSDPSKPTDAPVSAPANMPSPAKSQKSHAPFLRSICTDIQKQKR